MSGPPDDRIEAMFAAEESAIRDDGFSARVLDGVARQTRIRQLTLYGAGMAGFGLAAGGVTRLADGLPQFSEWLGQLGGRLDEVAPVLTESAMASGAEFWPVAIVAVAGAAFILLAAVMQER